MIRQEIQTNDTSPTHIGSTEITYDIRNNVTKIAAEFGGQTKVDEYLYEKSSGNANAASYAQDNLVSRYKINGSSTRYIDYTYDEINRLTKKSFVFDSTTKNTVYSYYASKRGDNYSTTQIETEKLDNVTYKYYYDYVGNITRVTKGTDEYRSYVYDHKNQLTRENNNTTKETIVYTYDNLGNIATKTKYDYTTSSTLGTAKETITYNYGKDAKAGWNHILTGITNGSDSTQTIDYDEIGNPTKYLGASLDWFGRELTSYKKGTTSVNYTYDASGLRATKNNNGEKSIYHYVSGQLRYEERGKQRFYYYYDATGNLSAIRYYNDKGTASIYFVLTNSHGDVMSIYNKSGALVASYEYDAWGNCKITKDSDGIGKLNPIRYRGYYYDSETGLYYLQSRYYNPQVGRFLNADGYVSTGQGATSYNMFAYCGNNPVMHSDPSGCAWYHWALGAIVVAGCAAATVITAGGFLAGMAAVASVTSGIVATTVASTVSASAFIGSAFIYGTAVVSAIVTSNTLSEFGDKGSDELVGATVGGALSFAIDGYISYKIYESQQPFLPQGYYENKDAPKLGTPNSSCINYKYKPYTHEYEKSTVYYDFAGRQNVRIDWTNHGYPDHGNPHVHYRTYNSQYPDGKSVRWD